ncbi:sushi, von Willebrand factor type A, EGF and pentraxin domain-containing protein 1 [Synchiropus splendidus]|uniref:sushi, von Willebrand factor type A, EGF and pentraxin domain-containing protein 1 n=1 Tax=Synchiropus splendidus TaxID=270530 RepID=UPI00237E57AE|nr:sushi, von Willebrand factor type A, EGF and pentraxin domain-containing protein 1 [Synchiropus splendidus]
MALNVSWFWLLVLVLVHRAGCQSTELMEDAGLEAGDQDWTPKPDVYWAGTAPLCVGGCKNRHRELRRDPCGDSSCCWLGYKSLCRVNCGRPDVDYNGLLYGNDWWVGSVVRYSCLPGFMLLGNSTRQCQASGRWSARPSCLRMCQRGRVEVSERELGGTCNSTCEGKSYHGVPKQGCTRIFNCRKKDTGWKRFFAHCVPCICECSLACVSTG